jgi:uroporphyrinogen III methyltransferase / synthase
LAMPDPAQGDRDVPTDGTKDRSREQSAEGAVNAEGMKGAVGTEGAGRVYLVGAGPGDPGLLTARALELIATADTILHDRLIPQAALAGARADAELLFVGKQGGGASVPQGQTEALMVERALSGRTVVRLKGGDPFVFGRGGEEAMALRAASIPYEVVPGVTSGVAAAAYAGIPVTHRGLATAVALVTGHTRGDGAGVPAAREEETGGGYNDSSNTAPGVAGYDPGTASGAAADDGADTAPEAVAGDGITEADLDWSALAAFPGTLVFYMGVRQLSRITESLIAAGRPASEPVAIVESGTLPTQRTVTGTLRDIAEVAQREEVRAPSITVVGPVAGLAERLEWLAPRPLRGRTVAVTRARAQASGLARKLEELGATVVQAPVIRIEPLSGPAPDLSRYDLVCFTSPNAVTALFARLAQVGEAPSNAPHDARAFAGARVAAIGPGTARTLAEHGLLADVVPERSVAESLVEALAGVTVSRALVARAREARDVLPDALRARGVDVDVLTLYETVAEPLSASALEEARAADYITFTSSSTVRFFLDAAGGDAGLSSGTRIVSIGPVTSQTLRAHGLEPHVEPEDHDVEGVVRALLGDASGP